MRDIASARPGTMGGVPCFKSTRLPVATVGGRMLRGDTVAAILADYPYLTPSDVAFAVDAVISARRPCE